MELKKKKLPPFYFDGQKPCCTCSTCILILVSPTLMLHEYISFIPGSNTPDFHYCNKCAHGVSCGHDETFMLSDNLIRTFKWVTNALIHVRTERMKKLLNTNKTYLLNLHILGCRCAYS